MTRHDHLAQAVEWLATEAGTKLWSLGGQYRCEGTRPDGVRHVVTGTTAVEALLAAYLVCRPEPRSQRAPWVNPDDGEDTP